jgi:hypothetical protein
MNWMGRMITDVFWEPGISFVPTCMVVKEEEL